VGAAVSAAVDLVLALLTQAQKISALIQQASASGSTELTADQWSQITGADDSAENALNAAIAAAVATPAPAGPVPSPPAETPPPAAS
jgi:Na+-transporting methylmalonyl-CoA/oxaloacetate decarboxylase gamma subunit